MVYLGVTVARVYITRETRPAFAQAFRLLWDTIERVTGKPVLFKFRDGSGLLGLVVDGCKEQINGYWDDMRERFATLPEDHPARVTVNPDHIPEYSIKLCRTHLDRYVLSYLYYLWN
jgi:hypothetical protein